MKIEWHDTDSYCTGEQKHRLQAVVYSDNSWSDKQDYPSNAFEFAAWLHAMLSQIPQEYRDDTTISLRNYDCDECSSSRYDFQIYIDRLETDEEFAKRRRAEIAKEEKEAKARAIAKEKADRATYERLKQKYGAS